ncbi:MAG: hypothetical protein ACOWWR_12840 [Eubacteriales bacterium]
MIIDGATRHKILREQWRGIIKKHIERKLPDKKWCEENKASTTQYYYWLRVIRQESLI